MSFEVILKTASEAEFTEAATEHLKARGYNVSIPGQWEWTGDFLRRIGRTRKFILREAIATWRGRGGTVVTHIGSSGRIIEILSNTEFDRFCRKGRKA